MSECIAIANAGSFKDFLVVRDGVPVVDKAKFLYLKKSTVKWGKPNTDWATEPTDDMPDKILCLQHSDGITEIGKYSYILI